jgi:hypothetical protein
VLEGGEALANTGWIRVMIYAILLGVGLPVSVLFAGSIILVTKTRTICTLLQLFGTACLMMVVLVHVAETFHFLPWMDWGLPNSPGHYLDLWSAGLGLVLFPVGYFCHAVRR